MYSSMKVQLMSLIWCMSMLLQFFGQRGFEKNVDFEVQFLLNYPVGGKLFLIGLKFKTEFLSLPVSVKYLVCILMTY